jgi:predicted nuclease of restriction endonuclease-like (RecB) superfamily
MNCGNDVPTIEKSMPKKDHELVPSQGSLKTDTNYQDLLRELQSILSKGQYAAYKAVDNIKVQTYWQLGERIVREELKHQDRADYGKHLVESLTLDLGIKKRILYRIIQFYRLYPIVSALPTQLSWGHCIELIGIEEEHKRLFYQNKAVLNSWGVRDLREKIKSQLYEGTATPEIEATFKTKLPAVEPYEAFKDVYNFNFLGLKEFYKERELEDKILLNIMKFLAELGEDFSISGRQVPIKMDEETHHVDLVLYHKGIPCNILVDLKIGRIDAGDIGQMNKYVSYWRRNKQYEHEKDTIGLIICRDGGKEEITYALGGLEKKIFVAKYADKLPSEATIKKALRDL